MKVKTTLHFIEQKRNRNVKINKELFTIYLKYFAKLNDGTNTILFENNIFIVVKKNKKIFLITCWETNISKKQKLKKVNVFDSQNKDWKFFLTFLNNYDKLIIGGRNE